MGDKYFSPFVWERNGTGTKEKGHLGKMERTVKKMSLNRGDRRAHRTTRRRSG